MCQGLCQGMHVTQLTLAMSWEMNCGGVPALPDPPDTFEGEEERRACGDGKAFVRAACVVKLLPELTLMTD